MPEILSGYLRNSDGCRRARSLTGVAIGLTRPPRAHRIVWRLNEAGVLGAARLWPLARRLGTAPVGLLEMPDGTRLYHDPADYVSRSLYHGGYERAERWAARQLIRPGGVVVDVGANVGVYTQMASLLVGSRGRVVAFEPGPALPRLRQTVAGLANVEIVPAAAGDGARSAVLFVPAHQSGLASLRDGADNVDGCSVSVVRLDDHPAVPAGEIDFVKIDVEGYESQVLSGAAGLYRQGRVRATLVEVSPSFGAIDFVEEACRLYGLQAFILDYRRRLRYVPVVCRYDSRRVRALGQANALLLRPDAAAPLRRRAGQSDR